MSIVASCHCGATRIELPALERLCELFGCGVGDLLEWVEDGEGRAR